MKRVRMCFQKKEEVKFISHLDLVRTFIRAMRRCEFPLVYSRGYNPQPRLAFADALPVGIISSCEYLDIYLVHEIDLNYVQKRLNCHLPKGIEILAADYVSLKAPSLMEEIDTSMYRVSSTNFKYFSVEQWSNTIDKILESKEIIVERRAKKKKKIINIRPFILSILLIKKKQQVAGLEITIQKSNKGGTRPTELFTVFRNNGLAVDHFSSCICREGLFIRNNNELKPPMETMSSIKLRDVKEVGKNG